MKKISKSQRTNFPKFDFRQTFTLPSSSSACLEGIDIRGVLRFRTIVRPSLPIIFLETQTRRIEETLNNSQFMGLKYHLVPLYMMSACQIKREPGGNTRLVPDIALPRPLYARLNVNVLPSTNHRETSIAVSGILFVSLFRLVFYCSSYVNLIM